MLNRRQQDSCVPYVVLRLMDDHDDFHRRRTSTFSLVVGTNLLPARCCTVRMVVETTIVCVERELFEGEKRTSSMPWSTCVIRGANQASSAVINYWVFCERCNIEARVAMRAQKMLQLHPA